jgi:hypothetical protein
MTAVNADTIQTMWTLTLVVYGVVLVVVVVLLALVLGGARRVLAGVSAIWTVGQQVANNTIHVALLDTTVHAAGDILASARGVVAGTAALQAHAQGCPGCPACVLGQETSR